MRIIIPGGSGLIGQALIPALTADGHETWLLSRNPDSVYIPAGAKACLWDGKTSQGWSHLLDGAGALINLTGENIGAAPWTEDRLKQIRQSRTNAGQAIVEGMRQARNGPKVLLQQSAIGCYGVSPDKTFDESFPFGSDVLAQICVDWEASTRPVEEMGVRRVVLRTGLYLTRRGGVLETIALPFRLFAGGPLGSGRQWYSWIHERDWIEAVRFLIRSEAAQGIYNLTAPEPVTNAEFGRTLAWVLRRPYLIPAPAFALRLALGKMSMLVLEGQRVLPRRLQEAGFQFKYPKLHDALEQILRS
ncbi:MAG TPA: TIGR01777 family oxidoreductase [Anaerolineaceae bacterium]|nr:TIGR01777 family oxidoreductase [Anaerolineaceae bacterium]